jgi:hypothetical protein
LRQPSCDENPVFQNWFRWILRPNRIPQFPISDGRLQTA